MSWCSLFPQGEVELAPFLVLSLQCAAVGTHIFKYTSGKDAVIMPAVILFHVEINGTVHLIGVTLADKLFSQLLLFDDVAGCAGFYGRRQSV